MLVPKFRFRFESYTSANRYIINQRHVHIERYRTILFVKTRNMSKYFRKRCKISPCEISRNFKNCSADIKSILFTL